MSERTHHVLEALPQHRHTLCERMLVDQEFRSLCEDYGEAVEAVRYWEQSRHQHREARSEEFRDLVVELEREILAELGAS